MTKARQKRNGKNGATPSSLSRFFEAADRADFKGWFYFPSLTPTAQMDRMSVRVLSERSDWLYKNIGAVGMAIDGPALDEVGTGLWPKWDTGQEDYDQAMTDAFHDANRDPRTFSADGEQNVYGAQFAIRKSIALYRDAFGQLLRPEPGRVMPKLNLLPGYIVGNTGKEGRDTDWIDGRRSDDLGRALEYMVLDRENATTGQPVAADDLLHFHDPFLPGQQRGVGALWSVSKRLFRREDIRNAMEDGTLSREIMGFAVETDGGSFAPPDLSAPIPGADGVETKTNEDGSKFTVVRFSTGVGKNGSRGVSVPVLGPGQKIKTLESNRPGTAVPEMLDSVLREVAYARRYPPEYIFFHAGMTQGTAVRAVNQRIKSMHNGAREFQLIPQFLVRWHNFWAWQFIKSGILQARGIKIPVNWWKHKVIPVPDSSLDLAREAAILDRRVSENKMPIDDYYGLGGWDSADSDKANFRVFDRRMKQLAEHNQKWGTKFTYFDMWPRTQSAQLSVPNVGNPDGDTPPPTE
jgi:hypothetical protein